jgi:hypothetical protein
VTKPREIPITERLAAMTEGQRLAWIQAHPSYDAVKEANAGREPSPHELLEHAEAAEHASKTKAQRIAHELDSLIKELAHQARHNTPVSPDHIRRLEAVRKLIG